LEEGEPQAIEHEAIKWASTEDLLKHKWAPADIPTVEKKVKGFS
jgi:8-oxo-dGTP diphosphatase